MAEDIATQVELSASGSAACRAVSAARAEAAQLGHERIGTEHLLLGLLVDAATTASQVLADRGASLALVRAKVLEVRPRAAPAAEVPETASERAVRAIGRSVRFSHRRQTEEVTPEDLLIGVLDVEGPPVRCCAAWTSTSMTFGLRWTATISGRPMRPNRPVRW